MSTTKYLAIIALLLGAPALASAAFDDVTLTTDAVLSINGITLTVSGSSGVMESITANSNNFTVDLAPGSSLKVVSADRKKFNTSLSVSTTNAGITGECTSSLSNVTISYPSGSGDDVTATIEPSSIVCGETAGSSSGTGSGGISSGGSGGGGSFAPQPVVTTTTTTTTPTPSVTTPVITREPTPPAVAFSTPAARVLTILFTQPLTNGTRSSQVAELQKLLNSDPDTMVSSSGAGSPGSETTLLGPLTVRAVEKFQVKHGIAGPGDPGYGFVGPKTRAKLNELAGGQAGVGAGSAVGASTSGDSSATQSQLDTLNALLEQVRQLQTQLQAVQ